MRSVRLKCSHCGGPKFIGEQYYNGGFYYVDVTCVTCAHTKDIKVSDLNLFLDKLSKQRRNDSEKQINNK
jgi:hypothetical protein